MRKINRISRLEKKMTPKPDKEIGIFYSNDPKYKKAISDFHKKFPDGLAVRINFFEKPIQKTKRLF